MGWFQRQYDDIKGNAKWDAIKLGWFLLGGSGVLTTLWRSIAPYFGLRNDLAVTGLIFLLSLVCLYFALMRNRQSKREMPLSLPQLFEKDFMAGGGGISTSKQFPPDIDNHSTRVQIRLHWNLEAGSKHLSIFVPAAPSTYEICKQLLQTHKDILTELDNASSGQQHRAGELSAQSVKEFGFTGRIYIYHDRNLSLEQLGSLEGFARELGVSVVFRGVAYEMHHMNHFSKGNK